MPLRCFWLCICLAPLAGAQEPTIPPNSYLLHIVVVDPQERPLAGARIQLDGADVGVTDESGEFYLLRKPLAPGLHQISISAPGYEARSSPFVPPAREEDPGGQWKLQLSPPRPPFSIGRFGGIRAPVERQTTAAEPNYEIVRIFYATDREDTGSATPTLRYANQRSRTGKLSTGTCDVTIPRDHRLGSLEGPSLLRLEYRPDPAKHVVLKSVDPLESGAFYQSLTAKVRRSARREIVVFIHGYNISFEDAARRTGQLAYDIGFDGAPILYSWPSRAKLLGYTEDEDTVQWTAFHLREFLDELAARSGAARIHLVAHSMGNRALASALQVIAAERRQATQPLFRQIVLAAPDIGADTVELLAREIRPVAARVTLYASAYDDALIVSRLLHGVLRAGQKAQHLLIVPGVDTVDASSVRTDFLGHSYYGNSDSIVADIRQILLTEAPPEERKLLPAFLEQLRYWMIPGPRARGAQ